MIRPDRPTDAREIWTVHEAAFGRPDEARLAARLRQEASPLVSLVAEECGHVIAHVLFSPVTLEGDASSPAGALAPVGVLPDAQGRGAGAALIRAGIEACRALDWRLLFVLGAPAYYARFGFTLAAPRGLHYASHAFDVAFQVQELAPAALAGARGWVRYHAAFAEVG
jgi:putative acetyltransferase